MPNEREVRNLARRLLGAGKLPRRDPDRSWGGPGADRPCAICEKRIARDQVEYELEFSSDDGSGPGAKWDRYQMHLRCFSAWEMERTKL